MLPTTARASVVVPSDGRVQPLSPDGVEVTGGFWHERLVVNRRATLLDGADHLEAAGNLENLRIVAGRSDGPYRLPEEEPLPFLDSDVYKWLEAVGWELGRSAGRSGGPDELDRRLRRRADEVVELVAAAQGDDGYCNSYWEVVEPGRRWDDLAMGHELYCAGHLLQAAVALHRGCGDEVLLGVATRFADRIVEDFGDGRREGVPGHPEIEMALVELYRTVGERRYLELASWFVEHRGKGLAGQQRFGPSYFQDHLPVREATTPVGHAVRQVYLDCAVVDVAVETGDEDLLASSVRRWEAMVATKAYLTGSIGSRHQDEAFGAPYELPPDRAYAETCAAIASVMWSWRLLLATGDQRYADWIERTLYNGVLPGLSLDGQRYFYANRLHARVDPDLGVGSTLWAAAGRREWFGCACCPPNVMRTLSCLEHVVATRDDTGLTLQQYVTGAVAAGEGEDEIRLEVATAYPWGGTVRVEVRSAPASGTALRLRVPSWCDDATVRIDDVDRDLEVVDGLLVLEPCPPAGSCVELQLAMPARRTRPHPRVDAVRGCEAVERGPLVYCVEQVDLPDGVDVEHVRLAADAEPEVDGTVDELGGAVAVRVAGCVLGDADDRATWALGAVGDDLGEDVGALQVRMVPFHAWANRSLGGMRVWVPTA